MENQNQNSNEIDLLELFRKMTTSIAQSFVKLLLFFFKLFKKYIYIYAAVVAIVIAYSYFTRPSNDENVMVSASFKSDVIGNKEVRKIVEKFNEHLSSKAYDYLESRTGIPKVNLQSMGRVKSETHLLNASEIKLYEELLKSKSDKNLKDVEPDYLYDLSAHVNHDFDFQSLASGFEMFFSTNSYVKNLYEAEKKRISSKIVLLKEQLNEINKYQNKVLSNDKLRSVKIVEDQVIVANQETYETRIVALSDKIIKLEKEKELLAPIRFFSSFSKTKISSLKLTYNVAIIPFLLIFSLSLFIELLKWLAKKEREI